MPNRLSQSTVLVGGVNNVSAAELEKLNGISAAGYLLQAQERTFVETSGAGT